MLINPYEAAHGDISRTLHFFSFSVFEKKIEDARTRVYEIVACVSARKEGYPSFLTQELLAVFPPLLGDRFF
jgi:hypothetical protein